MRWPVLPLLALVGCTLPPSAEVRLAPYVGRSEIELVQGLGVPDRSYETGGLRFLQYEERRQVLHQLDPYWGRPYGRFAPLPLGGPVLLTRSCDATFTLRDGVVQSFTLRGDDCR